MQKILRADLIVVAVLSLCWLIPLAVIGAHGNFPLNDDWAYARAAMRFVEIGKIERVDWTVVPAISHAWLGAGFASLLDLPFLEAVRWVGVVFGWIGMLGCYALCRTLGATPLASGFAAAALGLNPLYLNLSFTYMTDVPFTACVVWSLVYYCRGAREGSWAWLIAGSVLALVATLNRQTGLAVPMMLAAALILAAPFDKRSWIAAIGTNLFVFAGYELGTRLAYGPLDAGRLVSAYSVAIAVRSGDAHFHLVKNGLVQLCYLGCFAAPVVLLRAVVFPALRLRVWAAAVLLAATCLAVVAVLDLEMPPGINVIYNLGLGPPTLSGPPVVPTTGEWVWWLLVGIGFAFAALGLLACLIGAFPRYREILKRPDLLLCIGLPIVFLGPHLIRAPCFDRYLLPVFAPILALVLVLPIRSAGPNRARIVAASLALAALATFSIVGTRDYMQHHRARAALLDELLAQGIHSNRISGGFEFNGLHSLERREDRLGTHWLYVNDDEYVLTDRKAIDGYALVTTNSFRRLMPPGTETLRVVRRVRPDAHRER